MNDPSRSQPVGVVLLNLGGPDRLEDVEPFLFNLFSDRQIIRLSPFPFLQKFIARRIARKRAPKSMEAYRQIGGGSPLRRITGAQCRALEAQLNGEQDLYVVDMAMRYWHPSASETLAKFAAKGIQKIIALSLYPHYSIATSGSSLIDLKKAAAGSGFSFEIVEIASWPTDPRYISCLADTIREGVKKFKGEQFEIVYSAHSLPVKFIEEGDPYLEHIKQTIAAVEKETERSGTLCFQSRSGPVTWLEPATPDTIRALAGRKVRNILMVPISFVSDHVETLYEIDILYRNQANELGMRLESSPSFNTRPEFIACLEGLVVKANQADS